LISGKNALYPADDTAFVAGLPGYVVNPGTNRIYPVTGVAENTISGGDVATAEVGFSGARPTGENATSEVYRLLGNDCLAKELKKLNKRQVRVFRVDDENYVYGTIVKQGSTEQFAGFNATVFTYDLKQTGSDPGGIYIAVYYSSDYENEKKALNAVHVDEIPDGLVGVELQSKTTGYKVVSTCSGEDYTELYGNDWNTTMFATSTGTAPTTVTFAAATGLLSLAPAGAYRVKDAAALSAGDVHGLEGIEKYVTL
jgi:hypothetical protein